ncbi:CPBP family intramembrane glutamic endopeptidase [Seminibacterium arietis]|uniref:CPBP family intramembrane glutamic endopeptidase n=1 Tax=Seminibacterium arietis TaxID=1173502 RepID=A0ABW3I8Q6_9PAST
MKALKKHLTMVDLLVLTIIFWGWPITSSTLHFFSLEEALVATADSFNFGDDANIGGIIEEIISLALATLYLRYRYFDFRQLNFSIDKKTILLTIAIIIVVAISTEVFLYFALPTDMSIEFAENADISEQYSSIASDFFDSLNFWLVAFSFLNGFFEEIFFLGLIFAVPRKWLIHALIFSLLVRFSFHTYQGLIYAANTILLGVILILFRSKIKSLVPFGLAHAFFDIFGSGIPFWLFY